MPACRSPTCKALASPATATRARTSRRSPTPRPSTGCWPCCCRRRRSGCCRRTGASWAPRAVPSAVLVWIGTPLLFYMYIAPPMSHATSAFAVALFVVIWLRVRDDLVAGRADGARRDGRADGDGARAGRVFRGRPGHRLPARAGHASRRPGRRGVSSHAVAGIAAAVVAFTPQALAYLALNGYVGPSRLVARKMTWTAPHALEVVASPAHGFFVWTPLAVLALVGLVVLWWRLGGRPPADRGVPDRHDGRPDLRRRQRGVVDRGRRLRAAPLRRAHADSHRGPGGPADRRGVGAPDVVADHGGAGRRLLVERRR